MGRGTEWGPKLARIKGGAKTSTEHQSSNQGTAATMRAFVVSSASPGRPPVSSSLRAFSHLSFYSFFYLVVFLFFLFYFTLCMYRLFFFVFGPLSVSSLLYSLISLFFISTKRKIVMCISHGDFSVKSWDYRRGERGEDTRRGEFRCTHFLRSKVLWARRYGRESKREGRVHKGALCAVSMYSVIVTNLGTGSVIVPLL